MSRGRAHTALIGEVIDLAQGLGILVFHWPDSRRAIGKGWPDLTLMHVQGFMFREVKTGFATLRPAQRSVSYLLVANGFDWAVWTEADMASGRIKRELRALAGFKEVS